MSGYQIDTRNKKLNQRFAKSTNLYRCETENPFGLNLIQQVDRNKFGNGKNGQKELVLRKYQTRENPEGGVFLDNPLAGEKSFEDGRCINMGYHLENYYSGKSRNSKNKLVTYTIPERLESRTSNNSLIVSTKIKNVDGEIFLETSCKRMFKKRDHSNNAKGQFFGQKSNYRDC